MAHKSDVEPREANIWVAICIALVDRMKCGVDVRHTTRPGQFDPRLAYTVRHGDGMAIQCQCSIWGHVQASTHRCLVAATQTNSALVNHKLLTVTWLTFEIVPAIHGLDQVHALDQEDARDRSLVLAIMIVRPRVNLPQ